MINKISNTQYTIITGGKGECHCTGTRNIAENIFGEFKKIVVTPTNCGNWCCDNMHGTQWYFIENTGNNFCGSCRCIEPI